MPIPVLGIMVNKSAFEESVGFVKGNVKTMAATLTKTTFSNGASMSFIEKQRVSGGRECQNKPYIFPSG